MTENKRFVYNGAKEELNQSIIDLKTNCSYYYKNNICDLLNELYDENQRLNESNKLHKRHYARLKVSYDNLQDQYTKLLTIIHKGEK